VSHADLSCCNV